MKLIDKEVLLLALRKKRYSKQSIELIESQPEVAAVPVYWLIKEYLTGSSRAGCQPRYETVKEIIREFGKTHAVPFEADPDKIYYGFDIEKK